MFLSDAKQAPFVKMLCELLKVQAHLVDESQETGLLKGGAIGLRGPLSPVNPSQDGLECTLSTLPAVSDAVKAADWSFGETTQDGNDAISYLDLDQLDPQLCGAGHVDNAIWKTTRWGDMGGKLFRLPELEWISNEEPTIWGLAIYQALGQSGNIYQCVGSFSHMPIEADDLKQFPRQDVTLV